MDNKDYIMKQLKSQSNSKILKNEYKEMLNLKNMIFIPRVYGYGTLGGKDYIIMDLLGKSIDTLIYTKAQLKNKEKYEIIQGIFNSVEELHSNGYIHRDIKPSNFCIDKRRENKIYFIDFGCVRKHIDKSSLDPIQERKVSEFRGTLFYSSLNSHLLKDLGRVDDLWSFCYTIIEFLGIEIPWKNENITFDEITNLKQKIFNSPECIFAKPDDYLPLIEIMYYLKTLSYYSTPDYLFIKCKLIDLLNEERTPFSKTSYFYNRKRIDSNDFVLNQNVSSFIGAKRAQVDSKNSTEANESLNAYFDKSAFEIKKQNLYIEAIYLNVILAKLFENQYEAYNQGYFSTMTFS